MGYTTTFEGTFTVDPPLNETEVDYLARFAETRRMHRGKGPYYVDGGGVCGQDREPDIIDYNQPPPGQPGLWCQWVPTDDGTGIEWDGGEKFYSADLWLIYLINVFLKPVAVALFYRRSVKASLVRIGADQRGAAAPVLPPEFDAFTFDHMVNGRVEARGESPDDRWTLVAVNNRVTVERGGLVGADLADVEALELES